MQKNASVTNPAGVAAVVLAVRPGWWCEKYPWLCCAGGGVGNAHVLWGVGFALPKTAVALALGGDALGGADGWLANGKFHGVSIKKARVEAGCGCG